MGHKRHRDTLRGIGDWGLGSAVSVVCLLMRVMFCCFGSGLRATGLFCAPAVWVMLCWCT